LDLTGSCFIFSAYVSVLTSLSAVSILTSVPFSSLSRESRFLSRDLERFLSRDRDLLDRFDFFDRDELRSLLDRSRLLLKWTLRDCTDRFCSLTVNFATSGGLRMRNSPSFSTSGSLLTSTSFSWSASFWSFFFFLFFSFTTFFVQSCLLCWIWNEKLFENLNWELNSKSLMLKNILT